MHIFLNAGNKIPSHINQELIMKDKKTLSEFKS